MGKEKEMNITIRHLDKYYGRKQALSDVTMTIPKGMFGLLGRNGAGKTTLMKILATLSKKQSGTVEICGIPVENAAEIRRITGYLPQEFNMYPGMSVYEAMDYLGVLSGLSKQERRKRIPVLLERVNLQDDRKKKVKALSGGMKRRLGIAQAVIHDPKVLIVDEPIVILSTHITGDIEASCEEIAVLEEGKLLFRGTVEELLRSVRGKVFRAEISRHELDDLKERCIVTSMLTLGNNVMARFISEQKPFPGAERCEAGVEDAYMYLMQGRSDASCS